MQMPIVAILCAVSAAVGPAAPWTQPRGEVPIIFTGAIRPLQRPDGAGVFSIIHDLALSVMQATGR